jgi:CheY-like chemotaxis protein
VTTQLRAVLIDDEPDNIEVLELTLSFHDIKVYFAYNADAGIALVREHHPDFVLLDIRMPQKSGYDALTEIRQDPSCKEIPVIALTAHAMEGDKEKITSAGFDGYITKPVDVTTLVSSIEETIKAPRNASI